MSTTNRKVRFEVEDAGVRRMMDDLSSSAKDLGRNMMGSANEMNLSAGQYTRYLEEQIRIMERKQALYREERRLSIDSQYQSARAIDPVAANKAYSQAQAEFRRESGEDNMQVKLLRELIATIKDTARAEIRENKKEVERNIHRYDKGRLEVSEEGRLKLEEQRRILAQEKGDGAGGLTWKGVMGGTFLGNMASNALSRVGQIGSAFASAQDAELVQAQLWSAIPYIGGAMASAQSRHLQSSEQRNIALNRLGALTGRAGINPNDKSGIWEIKQNLEKARDAEIDAVYKRFPVKPLDGGMVRFDDDDLNSENDPFGSIKVQRHQERVLQAANNQKASRDIGDIKRKYAKMSSETKRQARYEADDLDKSLSEQWSYLDLGVTQNEFLPVAQRLAGAYGSGRNIQTMTRNSLELQKSRGLDEGLLNRIAGQMRYDSGRGWLRGNSMVDNIGQMEDIFRQSGIISWGDRTRLSESLGFVADINQGRLGRGLESTNAVQSAQYKAAFEKLGGSFAHTSETIMGIDQSLSAPKNEFQEGMNFGIYSRIMAKQGKNATYIGFKKWQESGAFGEGRMSESIGMIQDLFGADSELGALAAKEMFGLKSYEQADAFMKGMSPEDFNNMTGEANVGGYSSRYAEDAKGYTTNRERSMANIEEAFIASMSDGMKMVFNEVGNSIADKISAADFPLSDEIAKVFESWFNER